MSEHIQNMPLFAAIAKKLNINTPSELAAFSLEQVQEAAAGVASHSDCSDLHAEVVGRLNQSVTRARQAVTRTNPQLLQTPLLDVNPPAGRRGRRSNNFVSPRGGQFVNEGDVSSMFSPAAYLTEMYHNAEQLHDTSSARHLDKRRPDLASLTLNQDNLNTSLSTLSLSNEILQATLKKQDRYSTDENLHAALAADLSNPEGPYHHAFTGISEALRAREASPRTLLAPENRPAGGDKVATLCLELGISPALYTQLTTNITLVNAEQEYKKVFGDTLPETLLNAQALSARYNLPKAMFEAALASSVLNAPGANGNGIDNVKTGSVILPRAGKTFTRQSLTAIDSFGESISGRYKVDAEVVTRGNAEGTYRVHAIGSDESPEYSLSLSPSPGAWVPHDSASAVALPQRAGAVHRSVYLFCGTSDSFSTAQILLKMEAHTSHSWLLHLHRLVMLFQATGLPLPLLEHAMATTATGSDLLAALQHQRVLQQRYALPFEDARVLAGGLIDTDSQQNVPSQFERMFNTPPLEGIKLTPFDYVNHIATSGKELRATRALQRAFGVVYEDIQTLLQITEKRSYASDVAVPTISALYRSKLLADIHGLSVTELATLLPLLGVNGPLAKEHFASVVDKVWTATHWLRAQNLSVAGLNALLTNDFTPVQTPEITALITALLSDVALPVDKDAGPASLSPDDLIPALAPHFTTSLGLTSPEMTGLVLRWLEQDGGHVVTFWNAIRHLNPGASDFIVPQDALIYCQRLGQFAALVKGLDLHERELDLVVNHFKRLQKDAARATRSVDHLMLLSRFHGWVASLGEQASVALTALQEGTLTVKQLAEQMLLDKETLQITATQAGTTSLQDFLTLARLLQWHQATLTLGVNAATINDLFTLRYVAKEGEPQIEYTQWPHLSGNLLAGLNAGERLAVQAIQDERLSSALSLLYMGKVAPAELTLKTRDDLYGYLLIDSQVSADVMTTRIAEAMASLQLYVNRCMQLGHLEPEVKTTALRRAFFLNWATYNRRYSTWAGVSQLAYYPENYIDPTQRIGETTLMQALQQSLNQGQLTKDQVEGAFKSYLTEFEKVADLKVISGYHDGLFNENGHIWLLGTTRADTPVYYFRRVDMNLFKDGKLPATAWTEWQEITLAATPVKSLIRPVIHNGRLHLVWVEQRQNGMKDDRPVWAYDLKVSYLCQDNTWSAALSLEYRGSGLEKMFNPIDKGTIEGQPADSKVNAPDLLCAFDDTTQTLLLGFYHPNDFESIHVIFVYSADFQLISAINYFEAKDDYDYEALKKAKALTQRLQSMMSDLTSSKMAGRFASDGDTARTHPSPRLYTTEDGAQFMTWGSNEENKVRLNTLFSSELVNRANRGLDAILNLETQKIHEPNIGRYGARVTLTLDKGLHLVFGMNFYFYMEQTDISATGATVTVLRSTPLSMKDNIQVQVFLKYYPDAPSDPNNLYLQFCNSDGRRDKLRFHKKPEQDVWSLDEGYNNGTFKGLIGIDKVESFKEIVGTEPMDFAGANALYFWELFYYTPMLIVQRLLQEQNFDEAERWLRYVFSPAGYRGDTSRYWNTRPLLDDISWNDTPLDSTDPDAVAQSDPMHYKVATLLRQLELLTARGDQAYRKLERDSLAEAKMWYVQALALMGDEPATHPAVWAATTLKDAASKVMNRLQGMETYQAAPVRMLSAQPYTANTLTGVFKPQQNAHWQAVRRDLVQRLYNLRHNLSLDGQPLVLPQFATPADPAALLSAAAAAGKGGTALPTGPGLGLHRFPQALDSARGMTSQLMQFGSALSGVIERQDAEAMAVLMQTQGKALMVQSVALQKKTLEELREEAKVLTKSLGGAEKRQAYYSDLYDENISVGEGFALGARVTAGALQTASRPLMTVAAAANIAPNIFGMAVGGSQWGSIPFAAGMVLESLASGILVAGEGAAQGEIYRRRREEWAMLRDNAAAEVEQITAQQAALAVRTEAAGLQLTSLETQQAHNEAQLALMQRKFSNQALYNWLRGRLSALYFQFYDLTVSRCLRAEASFQWETQQPRAFIKPGAWQGTYAGLLCGEALMLNLAAMESAYQKWEARALEVERTLSLGERYEKLSSGAFSLKNSIKSQLTRGQGEDGTGNDTVALKNGILTASVDINGLALAEDYPAGMNLGKVRRIKQISVTLPALLGPYQDVQAVLSYTGTSPLARGCTAIAVSRGMNDSGQFQLDFNDGKYLPFEGIDISDNGTLVLRFPNASGTQRALLESLSDIILHVRYTIRD